MVVSAAAAAAAAQLTKIFVIKIFLIL